MSFVENHGQIDGRFDYYAQGGATVAFAASGVRLMLRADRKSGVGSRRRSVVEQVFIGANARARPRGSGRNPASVSYFTGARRRWRTSLRSYRRVVYPELWSGIDLVYSGHAGGLGYEFKLEPGANPRAIRLAYRGVRGLGIDRSGGLEISTLAGRLADARPVAWQNSDGHRVPVPVRFALSRGGRYGFTLGHYDTTRALVLDPAIVASSGYLGGAGFDEAKGVAVDSAGNTYVVGTTTSAASSFPQTRGPDTSYNGGEDCFVAKLNPAGALVYAGYIGGAGDDDDGRMGVAVDPAGNAYVAGTTESAASSFPETVGPDTSYNGGEDIFVAKVAASGTRLDYAGYIGGAKGDAARGIAVDRLGYAYVTGTTESHQDTLPVRVGPDLTYNGGSHDGFIAKVDRSGKRLIYAGYIGGDGDDAARGPAIDAQGNAYVTGRTSSSEASFPVTVGPDLTYNGKFDGFIAKVKADGTGLDYAGYIGGALNEQGRGVAVDAGGDAYVAGLTESSQTSFPVTVGPDLTYNGGPHDAFVAKVNAAGTALDYAGYIGGTGDEDGLGPAVDANGNAYVTGYTSSTELSFPVAGGPDPTFNGGRYDAYVAKVDATGARLDYAGYIGGAGDDTGHAIAVDRMGEVHVVGATTSLGTSFPIRGGPDLAQHGGWDAFVTLVADVAISVHISPPAVSGRAFVVTAIMHDSAGRRIAYQGSATWGDRSGGIDPSVPADFVDGVSTTKVIIATPYRADAITISSSGVTGQSGVFNVLGPLAGIRVTVQPRSIATGASFTVAAVALDSLGDRLTTDQRTAAWSDATQTLSPGAPSRFVDGVSTTTAQISRAQQHDHVTLRSDHVVGSSAAFDVTAP